MKKIMGTSLLMSSFFLTLPVFAGEYIYKSSNKIDFVKIEKADKSEKEGGLKHPADFTAEQLRAILDSVHFNKKILLLKSVENRQLFKEGPIEFLVPYLMEAFKKVTPEQVVIISYFTHDSKIVIQDDRLTIFRAFVKEDGLHFKFSKLYAKMLGDRTTQGPERAASEAHSLRVALEPQPGQNRISWDPEELVFDLSYFGPSGQVTVVKEDVKKSKTKIKETPESSSGKSIRLRMKELDQLKKDELITEEEYQKKRKELLRNL